MPCACVSSSRSTHSTIYSSIHNRSPSTLACSMRDRRSNRTPGPSAGNFLSDFVDLIEQLTSSVELVEVGDFNIHMDDATDFFASHMRSTCESFGLPQHAKGSTHQNGHTLDLILTRFSQLHCGFLGTDHSVSSDHACILCTLDLPRPKKVVKEIHFRKIKAIDKNALSSRLEAPLPSHDVLSLTCSDACALYDATVRRLIDDFAPQKNVSITTRPDAPWFNYSGPCRQERIQESRKEIEIISTDCLQGNREREKEQDNSCKATGENCILLPED
ncbi:hypothetical protein CAPTEDRAFT_196306 [Capitella teleta]|uniref:Endonuclease/exonuclease/phosphatase domain-containing protein n=1 Tax=Capitella teleta TaxID=283909 RepID=R7TA39_CAPTE|nr:hypothetical protein CAPTEDRAFT_196306 [Capitella teleta]|eukprot:ELT87879.1 hypothetical protein CAPTEDRAFT_196306 [Capitella teleta]